MRAGGTPGNSAYNQKVTIKGILKGDTLSVNEVTASK